MECSPESCSYGRTYVGGSGPLPASLLLIGENPGARELESGIPFVGPAGKVLDLCLAMAGLDRSQCRITNMACCADLKRDIRRPTPGEITACWPRLLAEITACQPKVIVCFGNTPQNEFLPGIKITGARGKFRAWKHPLAGRIIPVMSTYHPSFTLHSPASGARQLIIEDLRLVGEYLCTSS